MTSVRPTGRAWTPPAVLRVALVLLLLVLLNVFDACATLDAVRAGAVELNPVMRAALGHGPLSFLLAKMALGAGLAAFLAAVAGVPSRLRRERRFAWYGLCGLAGVYGVLFVWHVLVASHVIMPLTVGG